MLFQIGRRQSVAHLYVWYGVTIKLDSTYIQSSQPSYLRVRAGGMLDVGERLLFLNLPTAYRSGENGWSNVLAD